jgi:hypothetical protein
VRGCCRGEKSVKIILKFTKVFVDVFKNFFVILASFLSLYNFLGDAAPPHQLPLASSINLEPQSFVPIIIGSILDKQGNF